MTDKELAVIDVLCGNSKTQWSLCDTSCSGCNFYFEDSDMGAMVPICIHGFGKSKNSCDYYMTHQEHSQLVRSCLANFKAENAKLRELLAEDNEELAKMRRVIDYLYSFAKACGVDAEDVRELGIEV